MLNFHNTLEKLLVLCLGVMGVAPLKYLLAEFKKYRVLALALDVTNHLLISLGCIVLEILEGEGGGHGCSNTCIRKKYDVAYNAVEMSLSSNLSVGGLVETIYTNLYLTNIRSELIDAILCPKNAIRKNCGF